MAVRTCSAQRRRNTSVPRPPPRSGHAPWDRAANTIGQSATTQTHHNSQTAPTCTPARRNTGARGVGGDLGRRGILRDDLARWGDRPRLQTAARAAGALSGGSLSAAEKCSRSLHSRSKFGWWCACATHFLCAGSDFAFACRGGFEFTHGMAHPPTGAFAFISEAKRLYRS
jgi:hypothetical protein